MVTYRERVERKDDHRRTLSATFCGHKSNRLVLMNNWNKVKEAESIATDSAGLSVQRYQTYMEGLEASTNKFKATWEEMWMKTIGSDTIKTVVNFGTEILKVAGNVGIFNVALLALSAVAGIKWIPGFTFSLSGLVTSLKSATFWAGALNAAIGMGIAVVIVGTMKLIDMYVNKLDYLAKRFENLKNQTDSNRDELLSLASEYETLSKKQNKTAEDTARLLDIQTILNTKYGAAKDGINIYTDAIDNNSVAIQENIEWIKKQAEEEAKRFLEKSKYDYDDAQKFLETPTAVGQSTGLAIGVDVLKPEDQVKWLEKQISLGKDHLGVMRSTRDRLVEQIQEMQKLVIEYEHYQNVLKDTNTPEGVGAYQRDQYVKLNEDIQDAVASIDDLIKTLGEQTEAAISANDAMISLVKSYDEYGELTLEQVQTMRKTFGEDYINALYVENGQIKLNKEALKELVLAKIDDAIATARQAAEVGGHTVALERNVQILEAYRQQVVNGTALTKDSIKEQKKAYEDLLKDTIDMIKQRVNAEKDALQEELRAFKETIDEKKDALRDAADAEKERLQDQLDQYKAIIDAEKRLIDIKKGEADHADAVAEKNKEISDIDNELLALQFDNSEEANARRLELEAERAEKVKELAKLQNDYEVENQKDALDQEYDQFEKANKAKQNQIDKTLKAQLDALDNEYKAFETQINQKIKALQDYLNNSGQITADAMALIKNHTKAFYDELLAWNKKFGTSVDEDIIRKWNAALQVVQNYLQVAQLASQYGSLSTSQQTSATGLSISGAGMTEEMKEKLRAFGFTVYHGGGIVGGKASDNNEEFAKLVKGEVVVTPGQATDFMKNTLPNIVNNSSTGDIYAPIIIQGNADKDVLPKIKDVVLETINNVLRDRGIRRNSYSYSV